MTRAEIEAILGPPGDYRTGPTRGQTAIDPIWEPPLPYAASWYSDTVAITVEFDDDGRAGVGAGESVEKVEQSPLENLVWRARRQWRKWFHGK
jgi:hypothetical protein